MIRLVVGSLIGSVLLIAACSPLAGLPSAGPGGGGPPTTAPGEAPTGSAGEPTAVPTAPPATAGPEGWIVSMLAPAAGSAMPSALVRLDDGYLAVGGLECVQSAASGQLPQAGAARVILASTKTPNPWATPEPGRRCYGGIWVSPDGTTWTDMTLRLAVDIGPDEWPEGAPDPGFADAAAIADRVVLVGHDNRGPLAWWGTLADGFQPVADREVFADAAIAAVTSTPAGFVAVGSSDSNGTPRAAVWTSADGSGWTRVPDSPVFDVGVSTVINWGGERAAGGMRAVTPGGPGLVAVGSTCDDMAACSAAAWWSPDGSTWSRGDVAGPAGGVMSVASGPAGVVAVGGTDVIVSADGRSWTSHALPEGMGPLERVAASAGGFVAMRASRPDGSTARVPELFASADGATWELVPGYPVSDSGRAFVRGGDLVALPAVVTVWWDEDAAYAITGPSAP